MQYHFIGLSMHWRITKQAGVLCRNSSFWGVWRSFFEVWFEIGIFSFLRYESWFIFFEQLRSGNILRYEICIFLFGEIWDCKILFFEKIRSGTSFRLKKFNFYPRTWWDFHLYFLRWLPFPPTILNYISYRHYLVSDGNKYIRISSAIHTL